MKVLIPDDRPGQGESSRKVLQSEREVQVSGIAGESERAPGSVLAPELRRILDWCPICDGGYRHHSYTVLTTVAIDQQSQSALRVKQYYDFLQERRWQELLRMREWNANADVLVGFVFHCVVGRVGIVTLLSPSKPDLPDTPLHYVILTEEEGNSLLALLPAEKWYPLWHSAPFSR